MSYKTISALRLSLQEGFLGNCLEYQPNKGGWETIQRDDNNYDWEDEESKVMTMEQIALVVFTRSYKR